MNQESTNMDTNIARIEDSFNQLVRRIGMLVDRSVALVSKMSSRLDKGLLTAFLNNTDIQMEESTSDPYYPGRDSGFLQGVGLEEVMDSFLDFGKSVVEEFGAVVTQVFDDLHEVVEKAKEGK